MSATHQTAMHPNERMAQWMWTAFILMFFCIQAIIWSIAITVTSSDASHAVVAGYDEQALSWDQVKQARQQSDRLGWLTQIQVDSVADVRGNRQLTMEIKDRHGKPISNAILRLTAFHRAAASEPQAIEFEQVGDGVYSSAIRVTRFGNWCFTGTVSVGNEICLIDQVFPITKRSRLSQ